MNCTFLLYVLARSDTELIYIHLNDKKKITGETQEFQLADTQHMVIYVSSCEGYLKPVSTPVLCPSLITDTSSPH